MQLCKVAMAIILTIAASHVMASGNLTQADLDNVQKSREILDAAPTNPDMDFIDQSPNIDPRMLKELQVIAKEADRLNDALKDNRANIIVDEENGDIDFDQLQKTIDRQEMQRSITSITPKPGLQTDVMTGISELMASDPKVSASESDTETENPETMAYLDKEQSTILWIFISSSMPEYEIKKALEIAAEWGGRVVYRGLRPGDRGLEDMAKGIWELKAKLFNYQKDIAKQAQHEEDVKRINRAGIYADPMAFDEFDVESAPTMVYERRLPDNTRLIGKVKGLISGSYLQSEIESAYADDPDNHDMIDLGEMSAVYGIVERDLIEEMKERIQAIDWARLQDRAVRNHFQNRTFYTLPTTTVTKHRVFDPSVRVTKDIKAKNGMVLAKAGDVFNPLRPYKEYDIQLQAMTMYIFDATDPLEVELVKTMSLNNSQGRVKLIATQIDREEGFKAFKRLSDYFTYPVTLLTPEIIDRFGLESTPARLATTSDAMFDITEYARSDVVAWLKNQNLATEPVSVK